jgi:hypothetical protein
MKIKLVTLCIFISVQAPCQIQDEHFHVEKFTENVFSITEVLFHDVVNPPAAARFYSYAMLTSQHICTENLNSPSLSLLVKGYPEVSKNSSKINPQFAANYGMLETAKNIIPSGYSLEEKQAQLYNAYLKHGVKRSVLDSSVQYAIRIAQYFIRYSKSDGYLNLSTLPRYQPNGSDSTWYPTPPEYMAAVEPYWNTVRPFILDSCTQFKPAPPYVFNSAKGSKFYSMMQEVYNASINITAEQKLIANYWDCNPFANFYSGHVNVAIKKISPGGHWMSIAGIACKKAKAGFAKTVYTHCIVAFGLHDGFISCWDEKYRSHRVRPKTAINKFLDEKWDPLLETPPFPEYTSGHSVISTISATILTYLLGENFEFTDNTEVMFGFSPRTFKSFNAAADEAAVSRFYGGIHYMDAIQNGQQQGEAIGKFMVNRLKDGFTEANMR